MRATFTWMFALPLLANASGPAPNPAQPSLCQADEFVYFSCMTARKRVVSVCGSAPGSNASLKLIYRFGTRRHVELEHPSGASPEAFRLAIYTRYRTSVSALGFTRNDIDYEVFDRYEDNAEEAGVDVSRAADGKALSQVRCVRPWVSNLAKLEGIVPCDKESALNLGRCE